MESRPYPDPRPDLRRAMAVLAPAGLLAWGLTRGGAAALVFGVGALGAWWTLELTAWRVKAGARAASALVGLGNLALLGAVGYGMMVRYPEQGPALVSGLLLHVLALFWAAFRSWWIQTRRPS